MKQSPKNQLYSGRLTINRRRFSGFCTLAGLAGTLFPEALTATAQDAEQITVDMIAAAEKIAGLSFTVSERESMVKKLNSLQKTSVFLRSVDLENSAAPAVVFNPILPGMTFSSVQKPFKLNAVDVTMPSDIEKLAYYPVTHLARLIETRKVSSTDLTLMYLNRLKKYAPVLHCVVTLTEELALFCLRNLLPALLPAERNGSTVLPAIPGIQRRARAVHRQAPALRHLPVSWDSRSVPKLADRLQAPAKGAACQV